MPAPERHRELGQRLGAWFDENKRDLPWRRTKDPYAIWLSEVMLQQTRVKTVEDYFPRFLRAYPTLQSLADADLSHVLRQWSGLGYYRRARALHQGAREIVASYGAKLPENAAALREISGIGPYTAGAIASIAFGQKEPLVDGNVARVLARLFALSCDLRSPQGLRAFWSLAGQLVPADQPGRHNEALMELGATVCLPGRPRCGECPVENLCEARARGLEEELPVVSKKRPPREVEMVALVARRGARVLLGLRKAGGLFGGMWEPPMAEIETGTAAGVTLGKLLGVAPVEVTTMAAQTHLLTHRKLKITVTVGKVVGLPRTSGSIYERFQWQSAEALRLIGMSSLAKKVLLACPG